MYMKNILEMTTIDAKLSNRRMLATGDDVTFPVLASKFYRVPEQEDLGFV